jgi:HPt (histidine-containing phosphotransfer) domain-containing protein
MLKKMNRQGIKVNNTTHLDLDLLQGYIDNLGKAVVEQMLQLYINQSAIYLDDIRGNVSDDKQKLWQESCHKMKGAAGSVGLLLVHKKLVAIEKSEESESAKQAHLVELDEINTQANKEFSEWLSKAY